MNAHQRRKLRRQGRDAITFVDVYGNRISLPAGLTLRDLVIAGINIRVADKDEPVQSGVFVACA